MPKYTSKLIDERHSVKRVLLVLVSLLVSLIGACGRRAYSASANAEADDLVMSSGLDRGDIDYLETEVCDALKASLVGGSLSTHADPSIAVLPFENQTSEYIDGPLGALALQIQGCLIPLSPVRVLGGQFIDRWIEPDFVLTGVFQTTDERWESDRRVQYFASFQIVDTKTTEIVFQHNTAITKSVGDVTWLDSHDQHQ